MTTRMLIDATHLEETRVVVASGNRLEDFDYETSQKTQLKGNIYLAKVTRVEPSLQAAFVDYGGNRHGFLAFNEIHPDYYRIPISDREELLQQEAAEAEGEEEDIDPAEDAEAYENGDSEPEPVETLDDEAGEASDDDDTVPEDEPDDPSTAAAADNGETEAGEQADRSAGDDEEPRRKRGRGRGSRAARSDKSVDTVGGDEIEDIGERRRRPQRRYRIQEVISRRQIILIQVAKEERGNKGAAITSYISLAGRYCVLMPNTPRGGGISRKIANLADRKRLKNILDDFDIPDGMAVIVRTAGAQRTKAEIRRDYEYLIKLWDEIRERTLQSTAPALVHEEGNLIKRSIRDLYTKEIEEVLVEGDEGYRTAKDFMKLLIPSHAKRVKAYKEPQIPLFQRYQVEAQIDNIQSPVVQLKSGGSIVLNSTEALVAIDVNSGRATRERNIEETAVKTNLEAADELARQLKLRDLAGLIVIDFIDMDDGRNRHAVERRLKSAMASDRARIQIGRISAFGLLEMSRQRLRPSVIEVSTNACPSCGGTGLIRSTESTALTVLRAIEEEGTRQRADEIAVSVPPRVAFYILNQKRPELTAIEERYAFRVLIETDDTLIAPDHRIEKTVTRPGAVDEEVTEAAEEADGKRRRRRGGRKRRGDDPRADESEAELDATTDETESDGDVGEAAEAKADDDEEPKRRRRGRRGGRRRRGTEEGSDAENGEAEARTETVETTEISEDAETSEPVGAADATADEADAAAADTGLAAESDAAAAAEATPADIAAEETPQNGRRRRSSRKRAPADRAASETSDDTAEGSADPASAGSDSEETATEAAATPGEETKAAEPPKPKRTRRTRSKPAAKADPEPSAVAETEAELQPEPLPEPEPEPEPAPEPELAAEASEPAEATPAGSNGSGAVARANASADAEGANPDPAIEPATDDSDGSPARKRRGWWNTGG